MQIVPFSKEHPAQMGGSAQAWALDHVSGASLEGGLSFTALHDGVPIASGGVVKLWEGRYIAWFYAGAGAKAHWRAIHKAVLRFLVDLDANRVEADVEREFEGAHKWMRALGFKMEAARRRKFFPNGSDASLYARVKE